MAWKVPYIDYPRQYKKIREELLELIDQTLLAGDVMLRSQLANFESNLASYLGCKYAVGVANCTEALFLSIKASGIGPGDEVITASHTMVATASAIHHNGAKPILVDVDASHNMDPRAVEKALTQKTKGIIPVHLNGRVADMRPIMEIAKRNNLIVIEDAAQALGATYSGVKAGTFGLSGCFSFYPAKLLGAYGDGGAVTTNDKAFAEKIRLYRNHGRTDDGDIAFWAFNSRLDNLHAAMLDVKLKYFNEWIKTRRENALIYDQYLSEIPQLKLPPPPENGGTYYDVFQNYEIEAESRDNLIHFLNKEGVEVMMPWGGKAVHQFNSLGLSSFAPNLPYTEGLFKKVLMLPMHCELAADQIRFVCESIRKFYAGR